MFANTLQRSTRLQLGTRDEDGLEMLATLPQGRAMRALFADYSNELV